MDIGTHHKNIQILMIEIFKIKNELAPPIIDSLCLKGDMNLKTSVIFNNFLQKKRTVHYGLEKLSYRSPQLWSLLPENI